MIAHCPACGTHYRHDVLATPMRGRCGRCDASIDLSRLRPYRLVAQSKAKAVALAAPVAVADEPLLRAPAAVVLAPEPPVMEAFPTEAPSLDTRAWENEDPLPPIPEMAMPQIDLRPKPAEPELASGVPESAGEEQNAAMAASATAGEGRGTTWLLWVAAGAIAGTGISWTVGGTTLVGVAAGTVAGAIAGGGWLRWMSPR